MADRFGLVDKEGKSVDCWGMASGGGGGGGRWRWGDEKGGRVHGCVTGF